MHPAVLPMTGGRHVHVRQEATVSSTSWSRLAAVAVAAAAALGPPAGSAHAWGYTSRVHRAHTPVEAPAGGRTVAVSTSARLTAALAAARPGDVITLADGRYSGHASVDGYGAQFALQASGTAAAPVTVTGSRKAVIDGGSVRKRYGLYLDGVSYVTVRGITVTGVEKGVVLDRSSHVVLDGLAVQGTGEEGIHLRTFSSDNLVTHCDVSRTGLYKPAYGEGVYVGSAVSNWSTYTGGRPDASDRNQVLDNAVHATGAENVDIKEGTTGGLLSGNTFDGLGMAGKNSADSLVDVKGNDWEVLGNVGSHALLDGFQVHRAATGWGYRTLFHHNLLAVDAPGYGFRVQSSRLGTVVGCDNSVTGAAAGFANVACTP